MKSMIQQTVTVGLGVRGQILNLIMDYCQECPFRTSCKEKECILWNIEQLIGEDKVHLSDLLEGKKPQGLRNKRGEI